LGYTSGVAPVLGSDGKFQVSREKVVFQRTLAEDEIDLESGFLMAPAAIPEAAPPTGTTQPDVGPGPGPGPKPPPPPPPPPGRRTRVVLAFEATREQIFKAFPAIANLADRSDSGRVRLKVEGTSAAGFEPAWLRNAVEEPLDEADITRTTEE
jgi:hypothetical protein